MLMQPNTPSGIGATARPATPAELTGTRSLCVTAIRQ